MQESVKAYVHSRNIEEILSRMETEQDPATLAALRELLELEHLLLGLEMIPPPTKLP